MEHLVVSCWICPLYADWIIAERAVKIAVRLKIGDPRVTVPLLFEAMVWIIFGIWYRVSVSGRKSVAESISKLKMRPYILPVLAIGFQYVTVLWQIIATKVFPQAMKEYQELMDAAGMGEDSFLPLMGIYTVILAAVGEELIFRGMTTALFKRAGCGFWLANILQAALFGLFHLNFIQGVYAFILGMALGCVVEWYGTLSAGIALHMCFNFIGSYLHGWFPEYGGWSNVAVSVAGTVVAVAALLYLKNISERKGKEERGRD